jgi:hypothetical protein
MFLEELQPAPTAAKGSSAMDEKGLRQNLDILKAELIDRRSSSAGCQGTATADISGCSPSKAPSPLPETRRCANDRGDISWACQGSRSALSSLLVTVCRAWLTASISNRGNHRAPHYVLTTCCDRGYGRFSGRPRMFLREAPRDKLGTTRTSAPSAVLNECG